MEINNAQEAFAALASTKCKYAIEIDPAKRFGTTVRIIASHGEVAVVDDSIVAATKRAMAGFKSVDL